MQEGVRRDLANQFRGGVKDSLNQGVDQGSVPAGLRDDWMQGNDNYSMASTITDNSRPLQQGNLPIAAGVAGAALGGGNPVAAAATYAGSRALQSRGQSAMAGMQGGAGRTMQAGGNVLADNTPAAEGLQRALTPAQNLDAGRGNQLPDAALDALRSDPSILGEYQAQFAQAASSPEPGAVATLLTRLAAKDPRFREGPLQTLQQMTGGGF